jgi:hypothetical protein
MAQPDHVFWSDGLGLGSKILARQLLGPGLGRNFAGFSEGPARWPDKIPLSRARPGLEFLARQSGWAGPGSLIFALGFFLARPDPAWPENMPRYT